MSLTIERSLGYSLIKLVDEDRFAIMWVTQPVYQRDDGGKIIYKLGLDITDDGLQQVIAVLDEMVNRRERPFDYRGIIVTLVDNLSTEDYPVESMALYQMGYNKGVLEGRESAKLSKTG